MLIKSYEMQVLVNGKQVKEYSHNGNTFIEGKRGSDFEILLRNNTHRRVMAVLSVDGKDVTTGEDCDPENSGGYVIPAFAHIKIPGWRLNENEVAKFVYDSPDNSYAATQANGNDELNLGVIGCVIFQEKELQLWNGNNGWIWNDCIAKDTIPTRTGGTSDLPRPFEVWYGSSAANSNYESQTVSATYNVNNCSLSSGSQIGTGFGSKSNHAVTFTSFNKETTPDASLVIYYDTRDGLKARGVPLAPLVAVVPNPFPAAKSKNMCTPPKGWKG
jgi:hypothetical protein